MNGPVDDSRDDRFHPPRFAVGDKVLVIGGSFENFPGVVTAVTSAANTAEIEFNVFGRRPRFEIAFRDLVRSH